MLEVIVAALAGLLFGSFLNVCIYRLPRDLSVAKPARSFCPGCERTIAWYDNIPVFSYFLLRGACRYCKAPIPVRYVMVEALTAAAFASVVYQHGVSLISWKLVILSALLIGLVFTDLETRILPDEFTLGGGVIGIALAWSVPPGAGLTDLLGVDVSLQSLRWVIESALDAFFVAGVLWLIGKLYQVVRKREGLGLGDVKMMGMIAAYLGLSGALLTLIIGSLAGSVLGLAFILLRRKDASTYELPFGSFLGAAALLVALAGDSLTRFLSGS